jgi:hypothetical protein
VDDAPVAVGLAAERNESRVVVKASERMREQIASDVVEQRFGPALLHWAARASNG